MPLFVYVLRDQSRTCSSYSRQIRSGCILPPLCKRPIDIALYAHRFARLLADRTSKPRVAEFTQEAVYAVLAFEWPGNYQQLQEVISAAVEASEDAPIGLEALADELDEGVVTAPEIRLAKLVEKAQAEQLKDELIASGDSVVVLARRLGLGSNVETEGDLERLPLLNPKLSNL